MVLPPPYALPNSAEVIAHFAAVSEVGLPIILYNNPGRTQISLTPVMVAQLAKLTSVVAIKDSSKDLYTLAVNGPREDAIALEKIIDEIYQAFYLGGNSPYVIIKECMNLMGRPAGYPRLPHLPLPDQDRKDMLAILKKHELIKN